VATTRPPPSATDAAQPHPSQAPSPTAPPTTKPTPGPREPALGIEEGGLHSAAALMVARFFMYSQLYFHPVRRAYDIHLKDFLKKNLAGGQFPTDIARHLEVTDNEVTVAILEASRDANAAG